MLGPIRKRDTATSVRDLKSPDPTATLPVNELGSESLSPMPLRWHEQKGRHLQEIQGEDLETANG